MRIRCEIYRIFISILITNYSFVRDNFKSITDLNKDRSI